MGLPSGGPIVYTASMELENVLKTAFFAFIFIAWIVLGFWLRWKMLT